MFTPFLALAALQAAAAAAAPPAAAPAAPARPLSAIPGLKTTYYDVTGNNIAEINAAIKAARAGATGANAQTVKTSWAIAPRITRSTTDGKCTVTSVTNNFTATAELPRLAKEATLATEVQTAWRTFVAKLEADAAARLWFVYDRSGSVAEAMKGKSCDGAKAAGVAALNKVKAEADAWQPPAPPATALTQ
jgi:predicted secreted Zn-dependent protease